MPEKILVAYTSKYGATRRYAEWIAAALHADLLAAQKVKADILRQYDVVIYGGGLYAGGIAGVRLVTKNPCHHLVVFTVGLADPGVTDYSAIIHKNFTPERFAQTKFFHLRGGIDYKKLGPLHRVMMAMMKGMIQKKPASAREAEDTEFLNTYNSKVHFEDKSAIDSLINYVKSL